MNDDDFKKVSLMMKVHFPKVISNAKETGKFITGEEFRCELCEDFINKHCVGEGRKGQFVFDCMIGKVNRSDIKIGFSNEN